MVAKICLDTLHLSCGGTTRQRRSTIQMESSRGRVLLFQRGQVGGVFTGISWCMQSRITAMISAKMATGSDSSRVMSGSCYQVYQQKSWPKDSHKWVLRGDGRNIKHRLKSSLRLVQTAANPSVISLVLSSPYFLPFLYPPPGYVTKQSSSETLKVLQVLQ